MCITHSTMKSEFVALVEAGKVAKWLRDFLLEISLTSKSMNSISILCNSQATLALAYSKIYNEKSRLISLRHYYVRKLIKSVIISLTFMKTIENLADPFTKHLTREVVKSTEAL
ncbi:unnamed protein product [Musa textilis]